MGHLPIRKLLLLVCVAGISSLVWADTCAGIPEGKYDSVFAYCHGVAPVLRNGKVGYVDSCGTELTKIVYTHLGDRFGETTIRYTYRDVPQYIGWVYDHTLGYSTWVDINGKVLISGTKHTFRLSDKVPEPLWNY